MKKINKFRIGFFILLLAGCQKSPDQDYDELMKPVLQRMENSKRIVDGEIEPPFPEKLGEDAVGTDSNNNGIRDDVELWINYNSSSSNERKAMKQVAKAFIAEINFAHLNDASLSYSNAINTERSLNCLSNFYKNNKAFNSKWQSIWTLVFYPDNRIQLQNVHSMLIAGKIIGVSPENDGNKDPYKYCKFNVQE